MKTLADLLASKITDEVHLLFERDAMRLKKGEPVSSLLIFHVDWHKELERNVITNFSSARMDFDPETPIELLDVPGYEGVTTYYMPLRIEGLKIAQLLWPQLKKHIQERPKAFRARVFDFQEKCLEMFATPDAKHIADVIMCAAMLGMEQGIDVDEAVWDRNRELLERMICYGSPLNPDKYLELIGPGPQDHSHT